ncbi:MAG TPA: hypothetical protein VIH00_04000, partial [Candidatus Limnocylindrales bacterium]
MTSANLDGDRMFAGSVGRVTEVDVADPGTPRVVTVSPAFAGTVEDLVVHSDLVVAAAGAGGIVVLDPATGLSVVGSLALPGYAEGLTIAGSLAYVADGPGGLRVVDLKDRAAPTEIASLFDLHRIVAVTVAEGRAYLAAADEGVLVVDVREPAKPRELGRLFTGGYAFDIAVDGDSVLLADGWGGLRVIDVSDPAVPTIVATVETEAWVMGVEAHDGTAYIAVGNEGIRIVDIRDPTTPREIGREQNTPLGHAIGISVTGGLSAITTSPIGVRIVDVSKSVPLERGVYAPLARNHGFAIVGDRAFVAAREQGLHVVDVSDPDHPREAVAIRTAGSVNGVAAVGSNVFMTVDNLPSRAEAGGLFGIDASDPDRPRPEAPIARRYNNTGTVVHGSMLLIAAELGLWLVDGATSTPCEIAWLQTEPDEGFVIDGVVVAGDHAYVGASEQDHPIRVVDLSNPRDPKLVGQSVGDDEAKDVDPTLIVGPTLYGTGVSREGTPILAVYDLVD